MTNKIRYFGVSLTLGLLGFLSLSAGSSMPFLDLAATPAPRARATAISLESQAGHSDGILLLGILIFIFIAVPIIIRFRGLRSNE